MGLKICLLSSAGGHLTELMRLDEAFTGHEHFYVTFEREDSVNVLKGRKVYFIKDPKRNPLKLLVNMVQSLRITIKERPDVIITTGAGVAVPMCLFGRLAGRKIVFIESFCRIGEKSLTGRMLYPVSDMFLVQWPETKEAYGGKARYEGAVL
ncbi:MAG: hypothetical protein HY518_00825 [Candidatus Aenigmarchaeota archaeon]|nr:hypothetical protein [Candidatus Aenigmarchaeota archaeon]